MKIKETIFSFLNKKTLAIIGVLLIILSAAALLYKGNKNSNQSVSATAAQVYFDGQYKIGDGKNSTILAIVLSSLLFGAVHIAHGFMYMISAIVLLGALGGLYEKQRNIWGLRLFISY